MLVMDDFVALKPMSRVQFLFRMLDFASKKVMHKYFNLIVLLSAFLIRLAWILLMTNAQPVSDFATYYARAVGIAAGKGYTIGGVPTAYRPVGYPAFLGLIFAIFGPSLTVARLANVILYMGILILCHRLSVHMFKSDRVGRMTLLVLALYPNHIAYSSLLASEILFVYLLLLGIAILLIKQRNDHQIAKWTFVSGIVFGLACLVRPLALFVPALVLFCCSERRNGTKKAAMCLIVYLGVVLALLPWTIRNHSVFRQLVFISNHGGVTLLIGNNPNATGRYNIEWGEAVSASFEGVHGEYERDRVAGKIALRYILDHPLETVKLWPKKLYYLYFLDIEGISWNVDGMNSIRDNAKMIIFAVKIVAQGYYMLIMAIFALAIPILFVLPRHRKVDHIQRLPKVGLYIILYFTSISLLFFGIPRFHFPVMPWIVMYVGGFFEAMTTLSMTADSLVSSEVL